MNGYDALCIILGIVSIILIPIAGSLAQEKSERLREWGIGLLLTWVGLMFVAMIFEYLSNKS